MIVGMLGAVLGGWLFGVLHISFGNEWVGALITAFAGSVVLLFLIGLVRRR